MKLTGTDLIDATQAKADSGKKLSMREWRLLNLDTCSNVRDVFFPEFCKKNGISSRQKMTKKMWECIWNTAMDDYSKEHEDFLNSYYKSLGIRR